MCRHQRLSESELPQHGSGESFRARVPRQVVCRLFP